MTIEDVRKLLREAGVDFVIKKEKGNIVKINVWVEDNDAIIS